MTSEPMSPTDTHLLLRALATSSPAAGCGMPAPRPAHVTHRSFSSLVREPRIRCWSHIDERCGGFFALGAAKASGRPVAVACTSGTAAANLAPAVIEAYQARVPLIVLTADRPPELREVGAGQTIDQLKLYGDAVKWFFELGVHDAGPQRLHWIRSLACRAYWTALERAARPRPPEHPDTRAAGARPAAAGGLDPAGRRTPRWRAWLTAAVPTAPPASRAARPPRRGVVAGRATSATASSGLRLAALRRASRVPLLADPLSGARRGPAAIAHYDLLLRDGAIAATLTPELVVCRIGDLPTSKPLRDVAGGARRRRSRSHFDRRCRVAGSRSAAADRTSAAAILCARLRARTSSTPAPADWLAAGDAADAIVARGGRRSR